MNREAFERWMTEEYKSVIGSLDPYPSGIERDMWRCWKAAVASIVKNYQNYIPLNVSRVICNSCGSQDLQHLDEATLYDRNDTPWGFDAYECTKCKEITLVCYDSKEKVEEILDGEQ